MFTTVIIHHQSDLWPYNHKVSFDGVNKLITVNEGVTTLDVQIDLYGDMKEWLPLRDWAKYEPPIRTIGGDPTVSGGAAGDLYFMQNGWRVVYDPTLVQVTGILFSDDYDTPWLNSGTLSPVYPAVVANLALRPANNAMTDTQIEQLEEIWKIQGLDISTPVSVIVSGIRAGASIDITIAGIDPAVKVVKTRT